MRVVIVNGAHINLRLRPSLLEAVDLAAAERGVTRTALIRGVLEDALDDGSLPKTPRTADELLAQLCDGEMEHLRRLTID